MLEPGSQSVWVAIACMCILHVTILDATVHTHYIHVT